MQDKINSEDFSLLLSLSSLQGKKQTQGQKEKPSFGEFLSFAVDGKNVFKEQFSYQQNGAPTDNTRQLTEDELKERYI